MGRLDVLRKYLRTNIPFLYSMCYIVMRPIRFIQDSIEKALYISRLKKVPILQEQSLKKLKDKTCLKCVFLVTHRQSWKFEYVYKLMLKHPRFEPLVLVCPTVDFGKKKMILHMTDNYEYFKNSGYRVIKAYDEITKKYVDIEKDLKPDILIYTNPYKVLIDNRYFIDKFLKYLTIYVPYNYGNNNDYQVFHNLPFHNFLWRLYAESEEHKKYSLKWARNKGRNVVVSGYPGIEPLINKEYKPLNIDWKVKDNSLKKIIWAPHHTITPVGNVDYSCFIRYCDFMLALANKYKDHAQFVFKPHPILKDKLDNLWGKEKADAYYEKWTSLQNCSLNDGDYIDLFFSSDAMIHDCGSFIIEYLYMNKPVMRTLNKNSIDRMFNQFAKKCLDQYYFAYNEKDIELFVNNVINGIDPLQEQRTKFVNDVLMPKGSPSQNIIDDILDSIDNQILYRD